MARSLGAAPSPTGFGDRSAQAGALRESKIKLQTSNSKLQRSFKLQDSSANGQALEAWDLKFLWNLNFDACMARQEP
jgi:hypothetical protein